MKKKTAVLIIVILISPIIFVVFTNTMGIFDFFTQYDVKYNVNGVIVCNETENQYAPQACTDGVGGVIITWYDYRSGEADIYAQRIGPNGNKLWNSSGVAICTVEDRQYTPLICSDGNGGAIIVWANGSLTWPNGLYAQRVNSSGDLQWLSTAVTICDTSSYQDEYEIIADGEGGAIITWKDYRSPGYGIYAQRVDNDGNIHSGWNANGEAICTHGDTVDKPRLTSDGNGGAFIVWEDLRNGGTSTYDIYAQLINANGVIQWSIDGEPISNAEHFQLVPQIISDGEGGAFVAWQDRRGFNYGTSTDIYVQRVDSDGSIHTGWHLNGTLVCNENNSQYSVHLCSDGAKGAILMWQDARDSGVNGYDIYAQRINPSGVSQWTNNGTLICGASGNQYVMPIISDGYGGAIIAWLDYRNNDSDIYSQRISTNGVVQWTANGKEICTAPEDQYLIKYWNNYRESISNNSAGDFVVTWYDSRNDTISGWDIYAQRVIVPFYETVEDTFDIIEFLTSTYGLLFLAYVIAGVVIIIIIAKKLD